MALVAELIEECQRRSSGEAIGVVRIRHASSIHEATLQQAFRMLTAGSSLADTRLETVAFEIELRCRCGFSGALGHDDVIGSSVLVCPACGDISTRSRTAEIELMSIEVGPSRNATAARNGLT